ncbi:MAG TPA: OmpA family protein, partial [Spirochaetota bacterium]|nr:OmpA family protein [Spirochaetota bacterium]
MKNLIFIFFFSFVYFSIYSNTFNYNYKIDDKYNVTIKANVKIYLNNKYLGLNSKEVKAIMSVKDIINNNFKISGNIFKLEKTMRDNTPVGYKVDKTEESNFNLFTNGNIVADNNIFPLIYNVPIFPDKKISIGDTFENEGKAVVDLYEKEENKILPIIVYSKYIGKSDFFGVKFDLFEINYGYKNSTDKDITKLNGLHKIRFYFDNEKGVPVYMDDHFTEEFILTNNDKIKKTGFYLYFYKPIEKMNKENIIRDLTNDIVIKDNELFKDLDFKKKDEGVSITINNLKFKPDSVELVESEKDKIEIISNMLKKIKNRTFMVIGHTALSGTKDEQYNLSLERAKTIKNM